MMSFDDVYQTNEPANEKGDLKVATDERSRLTGERVFPIEHTNIRTMSLEFKTKSRSIPSHSTATCGSDGITEKHLHAVVIALVSVAVITLVSH